MRKVLISVLTLIFIVSMITTVYAATGSISLGASSDNVVKGKTFTVTLAGTADNNITGLEAKLSYDTNKLAIEGKTPGTGFSDLSGNNEITIASTSSDNLSKAGTLYTITFKVLDTAAEGQTTVKVTNAILALVNEQAAQENTPESTDEVTITIKADDTTVGNQGGTTQTPEEPEQNLTEDGNNPSNGGNSNVNDSNNSNSGNENKKEDTNKNVNSNKNTSKNTSKNTTKLPQTGAESASIIIIIALGIMGITSYVSYRKYKNI